MKPLGQIIGNVLRDFGIEKPIKGYEALTIWSEVVGERIANMTEPQKIKNGKLFIRVKTDSWRNELIYHKKDIIERLNMSLGSDVVKDIVLI